MHTIQPARLKPGVTREAIASAASVVEKETSTTVIRGRALILWDLKVLGKKKKLDAIDTDQITPAADCVSESLDTLDERWKAGAFRYLMPDFRARVHRGETFVVAGDRFAIGSSREMSPAGLKGVAEEAGLEMVVVCGSNMGDIFRRNALNLGLQVVQSPEAVADARDGDEFEFDPSSRRLSNVTQGKSYDPVPLTPKEDEIRRTGGIFAMGRRELRASVERQPAIEFPPPELARRMTRIFLPDETGSRPVFDGLEIYRREGYGVDDDPFGGAGAGGILVRIGDEGHHLPVLGAADADAALPVLMVA